MEPGSHRWEVDAADDQIGARLDAWLAHRHPDFSRARWQEHIKAGRVLVDGQVRKPNHAVHRGEILTVDIPAPEPIDLIPEDIPLPVIYEDEFLIVINKPPGMVVHPAPGHATGTLVHALLHHVEDLGGVGGELRPGIVHRLDRDTSGLLVVAKNETAMLDLARQFKSREVKKEYRALVWGHPRPPSGTVDVAIGRDPYHRQKMSVRAPRGRHAVTHYEPIETFTATTLLRVTIETGRTHQIRVHLSYLGNPIVGDTVYGRGGKTTLPVVPERQMLHAARLAFRHPGTGLDLEFEAPLPDDFVGVIRAQRGGG